MERGDFYRHLQPPDDPRRFRFFLVVSRDEFLRRPYSTVVAIPVYSHGSGLFTEVLVGPEVGLRQVSVLRCDEVTSVRRDRLTHFLGHLPESRWPEVERAMAIALAIRSQSLEV